MFFTIRKLALRTNKIKIYRDINQSNDNIHNFDLHQNLQKYIRTFLNEFEFLMILADGPIILKYWVYKFLVFSTIKYTIVEED